MSDEQRRALASVRFSTALGPEQIWNPLGPHVDGLHREAAAEVARAVDFARMNPGTTPTGFVLSGERGVGKTHMLGWLRQYVQEQADGAFFMPKLIDGASFWSGAVHGIVTRLLDSSGGQLTRMLTRLAERTGCGEELRIRLIGTIAVRPGDIDEFLDRIELLDLQAATECADTLRALVLFRAQRRLREIGHAFLVLDDGIEESDRVEWGFRKRSRQPQLVFHDLCRLFALAGPVVLALDQIDTVIAENGAGDQPGLADRLAAGLMSMREETTRTIIVAACIPKSWDLLRERAVNSAADRFTRLELVSRMPDNVANAIVGQHLGSVYGAIGFQPPYPTWPVLPTAFDDADVTKQTPRQLLKHLEAHIARCLTTNTVTELARFGEVPVDPAPPVAPEADLDVLDERFAQLWEAADTTAPLDPGHEDEEMLTLLEAALQSYVVEQHRGDLQVAMNVDSRVRPALHARLCRTLDEANEDEEHWSFRAISHPNARAVLTRLRSAYLESGIRPGSSKRKLVVLRNTAFSNGKVTLATLAEFEDAAGVSVPISTEDLRTFTALATLLTEPTAALPGWLASRQPASRSALFTQVFADLPEPVAGNGSTPQAPDPAPDPPTKNEPTISFGRNAKTGALLDIPLEMFRRHIAVYAGSGSGKTVWLRRLVEEAALHGVSSILIDTNNDLARLGDRWPTRPDGWEPGEEERADRYFDGSDVVIWTPRREAGNPLALDPLPDFSGVLDSPDEFRMAIDATVAGLVPKVGLPTRQQRRGRAVLTESLDRFARRGGRELGEFVTLLSELPEGVSTIVNAAKLAAEMAEELKAAMINDPIFGGAGTRLDPGMLLTPAPGKRARISVISCIGLPVDEQRQTFVNQLQLALFAWVKRNPAADRPLGGLLVLDEAHTFVPAQKMTASSESTLQLAAQARKYGLGMVYATQAPKGLHNRVSGNAATQLFGKLISSTQIDEARRLAQAQGGDARDITQLRPGQFYVATDGAGFPKIRSSMCLSHHPASALTEDEVLTRARATRP